MWCGRGLTSWSQPQQTTVCECGPLRATTWAALVSRSPGTLPTQPPSSTQPQPYRHPVQVGRSQLGHWKLTSGELKLFTPAGSESCFPEPEKGGEAEEKGEGEAEERVMEQSPLETPAEELAALQDKVGSGPQYLDIFMMCLNCTAGPGHCLPQWNRAEDGG